MEAESLRSNSLLAKWTNGDEKEFLLRLIEEKRVAFETFKNQT